MLEAVRPGTACLKVTQDPTAAYHALRDAPAREESPRVEKQKAPRITPGEVERQLWRDPMDLHVLERNHPRPRRLRYRSLHL